MSYGRGRVRPAVPDEQQSRPERRGKRQIAAYVPIDLYARLDLACRRADVSLSRAIREGVRMWIHVQQRARTRDGQTNR